MYNLFWSVQFFAGLLLDMTVDAAARSAGMAPSKKEVYFVTFMQIILLVLYILFTTYGDDYEKEKYPSEYFLIDF